MRGVGQGPAFLLQGGLAVRCMGAGANVVDFGSSGVELGPATPVILLQEWVDVQPVQVRENWA